MGGYSWKIWGGVEDYRWVSVRKGFGPVSWKLFHLFFICIYQNFLLMFLALPILWVHDSKVPMGIYDGFLCVVYVFFVALETIADQQQFEFQAKKRAKLAKGEALEGRLKDGFIRDGVWSLGKVCYFYFQIAEIVFVLTGRHPNYFSEQSVWFVFFLFSVVATQKVNWCITGCILLWPLFYSSSDFSESLSSSKYPEYANYQKTVPRYFLLF